MEERNGKPPTRNSRWNWLQHTSNMFASGKDLNQQKADQVKDANGVDKRLPKNLFPTQSTPQQNSTNSLSLVTLNGASNGGSPKMKPSSSPESSESHKMDMSEFLLSGTPSTKAWMVGNHAAYYKNQQSDKFKADIKKAGQQEDSGTDTLSRKDNYKFKRSIIDFFPCKDAYLPYVIAVIFFITGCGIAVAVFVPLYRNNTDAARLDLNVRCNQFSSLLYLEIQRSTALLMSFAAFIGTQQTMTMGTFYSYMSRIPLGVAHIDRVDYMLQVYNANMSYIESQYNVSVKWWNSSTRALYPAPTNMSVYYPIIYSLYSNNSMNTLPNSNFTGYDTFTSLSRRDAISNAITSNVMSITSTSYSFTGELSFFIIAPVVAPVYQQGFRQLLAARYNVMDTFSSAMTQFDNVENEGVFVYSQDEYGLVEVIASSNININLSRSLTPSYISSLKLPFHMHTYTSIPVADKVWNVACFKKFSQPYVAIALIVVILVFTVVFTVLLYNYVRKLLTTRARAKMQGHQLIVVGNNALAILTAISDPLVILDKRGHIIDANDLALDLLGYSLNDVLHGARPIKFKDVFIPKARLSELFPEQSDPTFTEQNSSSVSCASSLRYDTPRSVNNLKSTGTDHRTSLCDGGAVENLGLDSASSASSNGPPTVSDKLGSEAEASTVFFNDIAGFEALDASKPSDANGNEHRFRSTHCEVIVRRKDGTTLEADVSSSISMYGKHWLQVVLFRDITSKIKTARDLKAAKNAAEHANRQKSEFLGFICHEIRNPIHAINGICELMLSQSRLSLSEIEENVRTILGVSDLMHTIVSDVLDLNKLRSGKVMIEHLEIDVFLFVELILKSQRAVLYQRKQRQVIGGLRDLSSSVDAVPEQTSSMQEIPLVHEQKFPSGNVSDDTADLNTTTTIIKGPQTTPSAPLLGSSDTCATDSETRTPKLTIKTSNLAPVDANKVELAAFALGKFIDRNAVDLLQQENLLSFDPVPCSGFAVPSSISAVSSGADVREGYLFPCYVVTDPTHLQQIIINLVGNSVKFTSRGYVHLNISLDDFDIDRAMAILKFEVADTGIGFDPEQVSEMLNPYSQATVSIGREFGGTGLGLSIVNDLIKLIGRDDMRITTEIDSGTQISFTVSMHVKKWTILPMPSILLDKVSNSKFSPMPSAHNLTSFTPAIRHSDTGIPGISSPEHESDGDIQSPDQNGLRRRIVSGTSVHNTARAIEHGACGQVLVVEDNKINQVLAAKILILQGFKVLTADDGISALSILEENGPDAFCVILMDVVMPRMDGKECTRIIRQKGWTVPIVACTANAQESDRADCLSEGFDEYLTKPLKQKDLIAVINRIVSK